MRSLVVSWAAAGLLLLGLAACGSEPQAVTPTPTVPVIPTAPPASGSGTAAIVAAADAFLSVTAFLTLMRTTLSTKGYDLVTAAWAADHVAAANGRRADLGTCPSTPPSGAMRCS